MGSKILIKITFLITLIIISIDVIPSERLKERFKFDESDTSITGTPLQKGFKAGYFGVKKSKDKTAFAAGAARCAGEPSSKKIIKEWEREDDGPYKDAGIACHKAAKEWDIYAKQAFVAGASVGATDSLLKKGLTKLKLKEVQHKGQFGPIFEFIMLIQSNLQRKTMTKRIKRRKPGIELA